MNGSLQDVRRSLGQKVNSIRQNVMKQQGAGNKKQFLIMDSPVKKKSVPLRFKK